MHELRPAEHSPPSDELLDELHQNMKGATIRRREDVRSLRRRDGLIRFAADHTSQNGEDGILQRLFDLIDDECSQRWCVDVGAWDGRHLSNTCSLLVDGNWKGILIEADAERFKDLKKLHEPRGNLCLNVTVSGIRDSKGSLDVLLREHGPRVELPDDFDFLCIDIDGADYWVWFHLLQSMFRPKIVCIEFNPSMPNDLIYIPPNDDAVRHGASLAALVELGHRHSYVLVETTLFNAFFVDRALYDQFLYHEVPDTSIEALHEATMSTTLYQLYDGTIKLAGCKKLLWHRLPMDESRMQVLSEKERHFPFSPTQEDPFDVSLAVDVSSYVRDETSLDEQRRCSAALIQQLEKDGFCYVRGTGVDPELCRRVLAATNCFLQVADEKVRRSCLAKDRARRGYSPMCTENFASLIGQRGPNDLVRKFRVGPVATEGGSSLLQPNIWPGSDVWDAPLVDEFRAAVEGYYEAACRVSNAIVQAICQGLVNEAEGLTRALAPLMRSTAPMDRTSILTLLGYRASSRHKGKNKGPLVAPHTDVGVITFLLFDGGTCASLQRKEDQAWVDVALPREVPPDPVFVVNVADCFAELSRGRLKSTLHQVAPTRASQLSNRNCCALFVGLDPEELLEFANETVTYEQWRKQRIARAQAVLKSASN